MKPFSNFTKKNAEWIAGAVGTYILNELATKPDQYSDLLDAFDFYIVPVVNPDGLEYTKSSDRLWRYQFIRCFLISRH